MRGSALTGIAGRLAVLALLLASGPARGQEAASEVRHSLGFPDLNQQYIQVESEFPVGTAEQRLLIPTWNPGSYHVLNYDSNVEIQAVTDGAGAGLEFAKKEKDLWVVQAGDADRMRVRYRVHAADLNVAESWASTQFVLINAASVVLYTESSRQLPQRISIRAPAGMERVMVALPGATAQGPWSAASYDELVDSPIVIAAAEPQAFSDRDQRYWLVNVGEDSLWDREQQLEDVAAIVAATNALWEARPFQRDYWFFNLLVERGGGLEHDHSTVMMSSRWQMRQREDYVKWLGLVAHEYFHVWNVRRMRPEALAHYDFRREQYTPSLWLAEGITSYYDDLLLARARVVTPTEYLERLAANMHRLELTPGRQKISLERASRDAWTRHYQPDANAINSNVSYYTKGAVLGFALDTRIRDATNDKQSLDDVMRAMWSAWASTPYPPGAFAAAVEDVVGAEMRAWLERMLSTTQALALDEPLAWYGLKLERHPEKTVAKAEGGSVAAGFGINWSEDHEELVVAAVVEGLSAAMAGVIPGDELIAINDERVSREQLEDRKARLLPGEEVEFLVARHGRLLRLPLLLGEARPSKYEILADAERIRDRHLRRLRHWLGQQVTAQ